MQRFGTITTLKTDGGKLLELDIPLEFEFSIDELDGTYGISAGNIWLSGFKSQQMLLWQFQRMLQDEIICGEIRVTPKTNPELN